MNHRIPTALALITLCGFAAPPALAEDTLAEPPIVCAAPTVDCGPPLCLDARKSVTRRKAALADARRHGSASQVRKAKVRLAKARRERREDCKGFVV